MNHIAMSDHLGGERIKWMDVGQKCIFCCVLVKGKFRALQLLDFCSVGLGVAESLLLCPTQIGLDLMLDSSVEHASILHMSMRGIYLEMQLGDSGLKYQSGNGPAQVWSSCSALEVWLAEMHTEFWTGSVLNFSAVVYKATSAPICRWTEILIGKESNVPLIVACGRLCKCSATNLHLLFCRICGKCMGQMTWILMLASI